MYLKIKFIINIIHYWINLTLQFFFSGLLYPLCSTPLSRSPRCEFSQNISTTDNSMLPRNNRPRELRITPATSLMMRTTTDNSGNNITTKHTTGIYSTYVYNIY